MVNEHFVLIDQWGQAVYLNVYEAKNWNLDTVPSLVKHKQGDTHEFYLSHRKKDVSSFYPLRRGFLTFSVLQNR